MTNEDGDILVQTGAAIRRRRQASSLSLHELALLSGISSSALSLIETGKRDARLSTLGKIARALNTDVATFVCSPDHGEPLRDEGAGRGYDLSEFE
jgi:transcriptional regulator with XRE-family HTH domain